MCGERWKGGEREWMGMKGCLGSWRGVKGVWSSVGDVEEGGGVLSGWRKLREKYRRGKGCRKGVRGEC